MYIITPHIHPLSDCDYNSPLTLVQKDRIINFNLLGFSGISFNFQFFISELNNFFLKYLRLIGKVWIISKMLSKMQI